MGVVTSVLLDVDGRWLRAEASPNLAAWIPLRWANSRPGRPMTLLERIAGAVQPAYRIQRELGRGGAATVFLADDEKHGRQVALKVLDPAVTGELGHDRFVREIRIAARLTHPHILPVLDSGVADGMPFYVMPFVEGETLRTLLDRDGRLSLDVSIRLAREIADALDYAHAAGIVHRDVKPDNILLLEQHAVLADFGIARGLRATDDANVDDDGHDDRHAGVHEPRAGGRRHRPSTDAAISSRSPPWSTR